MVQRTERSRASSCSASSKWCNQQTEAGHHLVLLRNKWCDQQTEAGYHFVLVRANGATNREKQGIILFCFEQMVHATNRETQGIILFCFEQMVQPTERSRASSCSASSKWCNRQREAGHHPVLLRANGATNREKQGIILFCFEQMVQPAERSRVSSRSASSKWCNQQREAGHHLVLRQRMPCALITGTLRCLHRNDVNRDVLLVKQTFDSDNNTRRKVRG